MRGSTISHKMIKYLPLFLLLCRAKVPLALFAVFEKNNCSLGADYMRRVGPVNWDEFFVAITWEILSRARFKF